MTVALIAGQFDLSVGSVVGLSSSLLAVSLVDWGVPLGLAIVDRGRRGARRRRDQRRAGAGVRDQLDHRDAGHARRGARLRVRRRGGQPDPDAQPVPQRRRRVAAARDPGRRSTSWRSRTSAAWVLLTQTRLGVHIYAVGGDQSAAERAGVRDRSVIRFVFLIAAFCAAIGAILITAKSFSGQAVFGRSLELDVLTAVLLGGVGLRGGEGSVGQDAGRRRDRRRHHQRPRPDAGRGVLDGRRARRRADPRGDARGGAREACPAVTRRPSPSLEARGVAKRFGAVEALREGAVRVPQRRDRVPRRRQRRGQEHVRQGPLRRAHARRRGSSSSTGSRRRSSAPAAPRGTRGS